MGNVVELPRATLSDISNVLRSIADCIDEGNYGEVRLAGVILENAESEILLFGSGGACDSYRMLALMELGKAQLIKRHSG